MTGHEVLVSQAKESIENLFSDMSVDGYQTLCDLEDLIEIIQIKIEAIGYQQRGKILF